MYESREVRELNKILEDVKEKVAADPEYGRKILIDAGIYDENGNLTEHYRTPPEYKMIVKRINYGNYKAIVFPTWADESILNTPHVIEKKLQTCNIEEGKILFDIFIVNGVSSNRFIECGFENGKLKRPFTVARISPNSAVAHISLNYYRDNLHILKRSIILDELKEAVASMDFNTIIKIYCDKESVDETWVDEDIWKEMKSLSRS